LLRNTKIRGELFPLFSNFIIIKLKIKRVGTHFIPTHFLYNRKLLSYYIKIHSTENSIGIFAGEQLFNYKF